MSGYWVAIGTEQTTLHGHSFIIFGKPDGSQEKYGFYGDQNVEWVNEGKYNKPEFWRSETIKITKEQYEAMKSFGENYKAPRNDFGVGGDNCVTAAIKTLEAGGIPISLKWKIEKAPFLLPLDGPIRPQNDIFETIKRWLWPRDPIILDLDGDGLETVGLAANVYFDHAGEGVKTRTGWVGSDDALLVWDRNANGSIDTGAELFGDFTRLPNGMLAPNGYAALAALDENGDGIIDAGDPAFANLRLWRDTDQNAATGEGELISLEEAGIVSLNLDYLLKNQRLVNGNTLAREGSFTRANGTAGGMGEFHVSIDTFDTRFTDTLEVSEDIKALPNMDGAGKVRSLWQAASLSSDLQALLSQMAAAQTRGEQLAILDELLLAWADTSGMAASLEARAGGAYSVEYLAFGNERRSNHVVQPEGIVVAPPGGNADDSRLDEAYRTLISEWNQKLHILEAFNGQYFFNLPDEHSQTPSANFGLRAIFNPSQAQNTALSPAASLGEQKPVLAIQFAQAQLDLMNQAYGMLRDCVYRTLVLQTRLKPYLDQLEVNIDETSIRFNAEGANILLANRLASDPMEGLADLLDLTKHAGDIFSSAGWNGASQLEEVVNTWPTTPELLALLAEFGVRIDGLNATLPAGTTANDILFRSDVSDSVDGNRGNDWIYGGAGDDLLSGGAGNDALIGGAGKDTLYGGHGGDTFVFGRGSGHDVIHDTADAYFGQTDTVKLEELLPTDIEIILVPRINSLQEDLVIRIKDTGETLTIPLMGNWQQLNGVGTLLFADGTVWTHADAQRAGVAPASENDDTIHGSAISDEITGLGGNDILIGGAGDDAIDGGAGDDTLIGNARIEWTWNGGQWEYARTAQPGGGDNGNDTYLFGFGDGHDTVIDTDTTRGNLDTLRFKAGVSPADLAMQREGSHLRFTLVASGESILIRDHFLESYQWQGPIIRRNAIERVVFEDGTIWTAEDVQNIMMQGTQSNDVLVGTSAVEVIQGQAGADLLDGRAGDDLLLGGEGDDTLAGGGGSDTLDGGSGNDLLRGDHSDYWGGADNDFSGGGDTYLFGRGDGHDRIQEYRWRNTGDAADQIVFKAGVLPSDVRLIKSGEDLVLTIRDTGDSITVEQFFKQHVYQIESIAFENGTVYDVTEIKRLVLIGDDSSETIIGHVDENNVMEGAAGNDRLIGSKADDSLDGGSGEDWLEGGRGSDTYLFGYGDGHDYVAETSDGASTNVLRLKPGVGPADVQIRGNEYYDLVLTLKSTGDTITVRNGLLNAQYLQQVAFEDGTVWDWDQFSSLALEGTEGDDHLVGTWREELLDGGLGNDTLNGMSGNDIYAFGLDDGHDVIIDSSGFDAVQFKADITANDVLFALDGNDLVATLKESGETLRLKNWVSQQYWNRTVEVFYFENGTELSASQVDQLASLPDDFEVLYGSPGNDVLDGGDVNTTVYAGDGDDQVSGGAGYNILLGEGGNDTLRGGADTDVLEGGDGNDDLESGAGMDEVRGDGGNNTYRLMRGTGLDSLYVLDQGEADDTVVFGPGITLADLSIQIEDGGRGLIVGVGGDDVFQIYRAAGGHISGGAIRRFVFDGGGELTLEEVVALADEGVVGWQDLRWENQAFVLGSEVVDYIETGSKDDIVVARGNNDELYTGGGDDLVDAGSGRDRVNAGLGDDLIIGGAGDDVIEADSGEDVLAFNAGDGHDVFWAQNEDLEQADSETDTISFGSTVTPDMLSLFVNAGGQLTVLINGGSDGSITLATRDAFLQNRAGLPERFQFVDTEGMVRVFDFLAWVNDNVAAIAAATEEAPLSPGLSSYELTGKVLPVGGLAAIAYAQSGDYAAPPVLLNNMPTEDDDQLFGTPGDDVIDAQEGNDVVVGEAGNDQIFGGAGNDVIGGSAGDDALNGGQGDDFIYGGTGADVLRGGGGRDALFGGTQGDIYVFEAGDGVVTIDDDHRIIGGFDSGEGSYGGELDDAPNILQFGEGIRYEDLMFSQENGDLVISTGRPGDRLVLRGYQGNRETLTRSIDIFRFADGSEIVATGIGVAGKEVLGSDDDDWLSGTANDDVLDGGNGNDELWGNGGNDRLIGGRDSDIYYIVLYSETSENVIEEIVDGGFNHLFVYGWGDVSDLFFASEQGELVLYLAEGRHRVRFPGFDPRSPDMPSPLSGLFLEGIWYDFPQLLAERGIRIRGTPEEDQLNGTGDDDIIEGLQSADEMIGGEGSDTYLVDVDGGEDRIVDESTPGSPNLLILPEGTGLDSIRVAFDAKTGELIIESAETGNLVRLSGFDPMNPYGTRAVDRFRFGPDGEEISYEELIANGFDLIGTDDGDAMTGSILADRMRAGDGDDLLDASAGGDWLAGDGGDDTYLYNLGDGIVTIEDYAEIGTGNTVVFGEGISKEDFDHNVRFTEVNGEYAILLTFGDGSDQLRLLGFNPEDAAGFHAVDRFVFADGSSMDYAELISLTFIVEGDSTENVLSGTNVDDRLYGYDQSDYLSGGDGNDVLTGGTLEDILVGGNGRDSYVFELGDGYDEIEDNSENGRGNVLHFAEGITRDMVTIESDGDDMLVHYGPHGDSVRVIGGALDPEIIELIEFADGGTLSMAEFLNHAPEAIGSIDNQYILEDTPFSLVLPEGLFVDADGDAVSEYITVSGYQSFPSWLQYDAQTRTLYGTPDNDDVDVFEVSVTGTDVLGAGVTHTFAVTVANVNDAPVGVADSLTTSENQTVAVESAILLANDSDIDPTGDLLDIIAVGNANYGTVSIDADGVIYFTPDAGYSGMASFEYTVDDGQGGETVVVVSVDVQPINDLPEVNDETVTVGEDATSVSGNVLTNDSDADTGTVLEVSDADTFVGTYGTLTLNSDGSFTYVVDTASVQSLAAGQSVTDDFSYLVSDQVGTVEGTLTIQIDGANDAPQAQSDDAYLNAASESSASGSVLANDSDVDNGAVLSVSNPGVLIGSYGTLTLNADGSYHYVLDPLAAAGLAANQVVTDTFGYLVSDGSEAVGSQLTLTIAGGNDQPVVTADSAEVVEDGIASANGNVLANDSDPDSGTTLTVLGAGMYEGSYGQLSLNADGSYTYLLDNTKAQALGNGVEAEETFNYQVSDGVVAVDATLTVRILGTNDLPVLSADGAQATEDGGAVLGNLLSNDLDADAGDSLSLVTTGEQVGAYGTLTLGANGQFSYQVDNGNAQVQALATGQTVQENFTYTATDGQANVQGQLTVTVGGLNDTPFINTQLANQMALAGQALLFTIADDAFADVDHGDVLTYNATLANGDPLPSWLTFNAATGIFSGTPSGGDQGAFSIAVTATDLHGAQVSQNFTLTVDGGAENHAPLTVGDQALAAEDGAAFARGNVLANDSDADGDLLTIANPGLKLGQWGKLMLTDNGDYGYQLDNASSAVQSLAEGQTVYERFTYLASDGTSQTPGELTIAISGKNDLPVLKTPLADKVLAPNADVSWRIPAGSFIDIDQGDVLTYSATMNGKPLTSWLKFDAATQTFSGKTPPGEGRSPVEITVVVSDGHGANSKVSDTFKLTFDKNGLRGNEGLGNGEDPPPPGHSQNQNDGSGCGPGNPGNGHGRGERDEDHGPRQDRNRDADEDWCDTSSWDHGQGHFAYLDLCDVDRHARDFDQDRSQSSQGEYNAHQRWAEMEKALANLLKDAKSKGGDWMDAKHGADLSCLNGIGYAAGHVKLGAGGADQISLKVSAAALQHFKGLQEGICKL